MAENVLGLENASLLKKLQPRVSLSGKLLVPQNVTVRNISHGGKYLMVENVWGSIEVATIVRK